MRRRRLRRRRSAAASSGEEKERERREMKVDCGGGWWWWYGGLARILIWVSLESAIGDFFFGSENEIRVLIGFLEKGFVFSCVVFSEPMRMKM